VPKRQNEMREQSGAYSIAFPLLGEVVKSYEFSFFVIPEEAGIQQLI
jgi:hypothetical protein